MWTFPPAILGNAIAAATDWFLDNFTGSGTLTSHTSDSGHTWSVSPTNMYFASGTTDASKLVLDGSGFLYYNDTDFGHFAGVVSSLVPPSADYTVEAKVRTDYSTSAVGQVVIAARYDDADGSGYFILIDHNSGDPAQTLVTLQSFDGATGNTIEGSIYASVADANNFTVKLVLNGSALSLFFDGVHYANYTNSDVTQVGTVGLWLRGGSTPSAVGVDYLAVIG